MAEKNSKNKSIRRIVVNGLKKSAFMIITFIMALVAAAVAGEAYLRIADIYSPAGFEYREGLSLFRVDPEAPITMGLRPNVSARAFIYEDRRKNIRKYFNVHVNSLGLRGRETTIEKPAGAFRILTLGDSWTFGEGVDDGETYSMQLENLLRDYCPPEKRCEVINGGYASGRGPDEAYVFLKNKGIRFRPDVVILGSFVNDTFDLGYNNWDKVDKRGLPVEISSQIFIVDENGQYGYNYNNSMNLFLPKILRLSFLRRFHLTTLIQSKYIEHYLLRKKFDTMLLLNHPDAKEFERLWNKYYKVVDGMAEICRNNGARLLVMAIPYSGATADELFDMGKHLSDHGILFLNLYPAYHGTKDSYFFSGDGHWNAAGHKRTAFIIFKYLEQNGWLPGESMKPVNSHK